jgi:hypothetical protein
MSRRLPIFVERPEILFLVQGLLHNLGQFSFPKIPYLGAKPNTVFAQSKDTNIRITAAVDLNKLVEFLSNQLRTNSLSDPYSTFVVCLDASSETEWRALFEAAMGEVSSVASDGSYWVRFPEREGCRVVPFLLVDGGFFGEGFTTFLGANLPQFETAPNIVERLNTLYGTFDEEVPEWLKQNPSAHQLLLQAPSEVEKVFGPKTKLSLSVFAPRDLGDYCALSVGVHTTPDDAVAKLEKFEEDWFLDRFIGLPAGTQLFFNLRFE